MAVNLLVADDDRVTVRLLSARLKSAGYEVAAAFDTPEVLSVAERDPPAAILLDVNMPGGSARDALRQLRSSAATRGVRIIVMSSTDDAALVQEMRDHGADDFLRKPVDLPRLLELLGRYFS